MPIELGPRCGVVIDLRTAIDTADSTNECGRVSRSMARVFLNNCNPVPESLFVGPHASEFGELTAFESLGRRVHITTVKLIP